METQNLPSPAPAFTYMGRNFSTLSITDNSSSAFSDCNSDRSGEFSSATSESRQLWLSCAGGDYSDDLIHQLVLNLNSPSIEDRKQAAMEIRLLAKNKPENRIKIARAGAIKPLISLLSSSDAQLQEYGVTAILNLSLCDENKDHITSSGAIKPLVRALKTGTSTSRENAACAILRLSQIDENKTLIGRSGAIPALVDLLSGGNFRGKKDASTALYSLCSVKENKKRAIEAGIMKPLIELMSDFGSNMVDKSAYVLSLVVTVAEGRAALVEEGGIPVVVEILEVGSHRQREIVAAILLQLCEDSIVYRTMVAREGAIPALVALSQSGTTRAKKKIKGIALKASGASFRCNPNSNSGQTRKHPEAETGSSSEKLKEVGSYRRTMSLNSSGSSSSAATPRWGKELEARLKGLSVGSGRGEVTPATEILLSGSASGRRVDTVVLEEEREPKEWVAQVEPGVLITFVSLPRGGNDLKRIRFSRDMFNKWQAQKWWTENYEKVMELYNVQKLSRHAFPLTTPPRSEDEISKMESVGDSPITPPLTKESLPRGLNRGMGYSSSDSFEQHSKQSRQYTESSYLASTPKNSNISGVTVKTETSSMDESMRSTSSRDADQSGELSISYASDMETEWVEEDEPGVYITIRALPGGKRELRRVRFSREKFGEMHAKVWWEENRARVHEQYL